MDSIDFVLHARLLGGPLRREDDLLPSALLGVVFGLVSLPLVPIVYGRLMRLKRSW